MLRSNDVDGSIIFTDFIGRHSVFKYGNIKHLVSQKKFGSSSIYFDGSGDYFSIPDSSDWDFGTSDWTIDAWVFFSGVPVYEVIWNTGGENSVNGVFFGLSYGKYYFQSHIDHIFKETENLNNGWHHIAVTRKNDITYHFVDEKLLGTMNVAGININNAYVPRIGTGYAGALGQYVKGYIDELKISKGVARWTSDFEVPNNFYG